MIFRQGSIKTSIQYNSNQFVLSQFSAFKVSSRTGNRRLSSCTACIAKNKQKIQIHKPFCFWCIYPLSHKDNHLYSAKITCTETKGNAWSKQTDKKSSLHEFDTSCTTTSSVSCLQFFFKIQSQIVVCIIHS